MQREIPILFSTAMVQAILDGRKTQTRRIAHKNYKTLEEIDKVPRILELEKDWDKWKFTWESGDDALIKCRWNPGDLLWVKETHYRYGKWVKNGTTKTGRQKWKFRIEKGFESIRYNEEPPAVVNKNSMRSLGWYKRSSLFMSKNDARIWLEIVMVKAERLHDITEADAKKEGAVKVWEDIHGNFWFPASESINAGEHFDYRTGFKSIWQNINGIEIWNDNPWVWVVEFRVKSTAGQGFKMETAFDKRMKTAFPQS